MATPTPTKKPLERAVTISMLNDELERQARNFKDLMAVQEKNFQAFLSTFMDVTNRRIDQFMFQTTNDLKDIQKSLQGTVEEVTALRVKSESASNSITTIDKRLQDLENKLDKCKDQMLYVETQTKRNNVRLDGIKDQYGESEEQLEAKVRDILTKSLKIDARKIEIENCIRVGKTDSKNKHKGRRVIVKFLRYKDKDDLLRQSSKLKGSGVSMSDDVQEDNLEFPVTISRLPSRDSNNPIENGV